MQEIEVQTGTSFYNSEVLREFIYFLINNGFSVKAKKGDGGIVVSALKNNNTEV